MAGITVIPLKNPGRAVPDWQRAAEHKGICAGAPEVDLSNAQDTWPGVPDIPGVREGLGVDRRRASAPRWSADSGWAFSQEA